MKTETLYDLVYGGVTTAVIALPTIRFAEDPSLQFCATLFMALYGSIVSITGADEHKEKKIRKLIPPIFRASLTGGFAGMVAWGLSGYFGFGPYLTMLIGGALGYSGDKGIKMAIMQILKGRFKNND